MADYWIYCLFIQVGIWSWFSFCSAKYSPIMSMLYVCMEMEPGVPTSKSKQVYVFAWPNLYLYTYSLYIHFQLSLNILQKSVPPQPTTFHCPNKPTENHRFLSLFFSLLVLVSIQTSFLFISHNSCRPRLPSESVLNICRQAVVEVYILCGCLHGPHYAVSCINSQLLLSHLPIYAHTLLLLQKLLGL